MENNPMDVILNASPEDLASVFNNMQNGELSSFINTMCVRYIVMENTKNALLEKIKDKPNEEEDKALSDIYGVMSRIENVVTVGKEVLQHRG